MAANGRAMRIRGCVEDGIRFCKRAGSNSVRCVTASNLVALLAVFYHRQGLKEMKRRRAGV